MFLSVIIPARNEERRLGATLDSVEKYLRKQNYNAEIIVVADNCQDKTKTIAENFDNNFRNIKILELKDGQGGKGAAVRAGIMQSQGKFVLFMDADNATRIHELNCFLPYLEKDYEVVIGSRAIKGSRIMIRQPLWREFSGKIGNLIIRILILPGIYDTQCGFKIFRQEAAKRIFEKQTIFGWGFDVEILVLARYFKFAIKEMPIAWHNSYDSRVSRGDYLKTLREIFKIRRNLRQKVYG